MFCGYCGTSLPDDAEFCGNCGKAVIRSKDSQKNNIEEKIDAAETDKIQGDNVSGEISAVEGDSKEPFVSAEMAERTNKIKNKHFSGLGNLKNDKKKLKITGTIAVSVVVVIIAANRINTNKKIGKLEDSIFQISTSGDVDEDEIVKLYDEYESLSDFNKRKVANRETLITVYKQVEAVIEQRKQAAGQVDSMIEAIDYSNMYAEASTVKDAVIAYNNLDDKTKEYVQSVDSLQEAYDDVGALNVTVTENNFWDLFVIEYSVGKKYNAGGTDISQSGYTINWNRYGGTVTPNYDINAHNDYATPVYIYIQPRYPNLISSCGFYINLHQTYTGIGLVDSDVHEFKLQSANIQFDSSQGIGEYLINVEDNDASKGLLSAIGWSYDWSDQVHKMNPFDCSRVEISDVYGSVSY